jgi:hypothetical protein
MIRSRVMVRLLSSVALLATLSSCTTQDAPTAPPAESQAVSQDVPLVGDLLKGLLVCSRQPYARSVQVVGPLGGTIQVGKHRLTIPIGALTTPVTITAEAPSDYVASVRFSPEGLRFSRPATVTLDYSTCPLGRLRLLKRVAYTTEQLEILSYLLSRDNLLLMRVSGELDHFSRYAVAW